MPTQLSNLFQRTVENQPLPLELPAMTMREAQEFGGLLELTGVHKFEGKWCPGSSHLVMINAIKRFNKSLS